jgi:hypothetical protein
MKEIIGKVKTVEQDKNYPRLNIVVEDFCKHQYYIQVMKRDMEKAKNFKEGDIVRFEVNPVLKQVERRDQKLYYNNLVLKEATAV